MHDYILLDAQNFMWRVFAKALHMFIQVDDSNICQISIQTAFRKLDKLTSKFGHKNTKVYLLFDNPQSVLNLRKEIFEEYKHIRMTKHAPKGFYDTMKVFIHLLQYYNDNYVVGLAENLEADDLTFPILQDLDLEKKKALVISNDLDWARNITEEVSWFNYDKLYTPRIFKEEYGFSPEGKAIQLWKSIRGDKSDSIPNAVPYLPKEILLKIINNCDSLKDMFVKLGDLDISEKWKIKIKDAQVQIKINYQLADFLLVEKNIKEYLTKSKRNIKMLQFWYNLLELQFETFMEEGKLSPDTLFSRTI